ncbi:MAG: hypothetical protein AVDCRST_MAG70-2168 [uncultured Thermomicrobiales bacterium]|uniref:DUF3037 domain-containing protein n=1 Tax=uncultured Thermomicrobiales bacterium TaxID=1645740 RepID=A0A6J4V3I7_9BACT|nr:MAG: hypothetical protein AVDCRST_MAG70-2168 [uncultured Thermomicrobiales bacterium]
MPYEYAVIRIVPRVERGERVNAGVVLFCRGRRFVGVALGLEPHHRDVLRILDPGIDLDRVQARLEAMRAVAAGESTAGPLAALGPAERFRWLVAPGSTVIQPSAVHAGRCLDPTATLAALYRSLASSLDVPAPRDATVP